MRPVESLFPKPCVKRSGSSRVNHWKSGQAMDASRSRLPRRRCGCRSGAKGSSRFPTPRSRRSPPSRFATHWSAFAVEGRRHEPRGGRIRVLARESRGSAKSAGCRGAINRALCARDLFRAYAPARSASDFQRHGPRVSGHTISPTLPEARRTGLQGFYSWVAGPRRDRRSRVRRTGRRDGGGLRRWTCHL
jgi:hypothetical protein